MLWNSLFHRMKLTVSHRETKGFNCLKLLFSPYETNNSKAFELNNFIIDLKYTSLKSYSSKIE